MRSLRRKDDRRNKNNSKEPRKRVTFTDLQNEIQDDPVQVDNPKPQIEIETNHVKSPTVEIIPATPNYASNAQEDTSRHQNNPTSHDVTKTKDKAPGERAKRVPSSRISSTRERSKIVSNKYGGKRGQIGHERGYYKAPDNYPQPYTNNFVMPTIRITDADDDLNYLYSDNEDDLDEQSDETSDDNGNKTTYQQQGKERDEEIKEEKKHQERRKEEGTQKHVVFNLKDDDEDGIQQETGEYVVSGPQGSDLYSRQRQTSLPPLSRGGHTTPHSTNGDIVNPVMTNGGGSLHRRRSRAKSVLYPYIHGHTRGGRSSSLSPSKSPTRSTSSAGLALSKDDSRIHYEFTLDDVDEARTKLPADPWRARKVRFYRNGDRYYPGYEFVFKPGRDVVNMEALCDKISDRIGLIKGVRYIFGVEGRRRYRLEELEDGHSYVASSDRKFVNLAYERLNKTDLKLQASKSVPAIQPLGSHHSNLGYGRQKPDWNAPSGGSGGSGGDAGGRVSSPPVREISKKASADSNKSSSNSSSNNNSKPGSREGRTIKIINNLDHNQERTVLVNMKTINLWEDVVKDLGRMFKMTGPLHLYTTWGQEVKSFSHFKNDFANADTFYVTPSEIGFSSRPVHPNIAPASAVSNGGQEGSGGRRRSAQEDDKKIGKGERKNSKPFRRPQLRRHTSEPTLKETAEETDDWEEVSDGRAAIVTIRGQQRVLHPPRQILHHNPSPPHSTLTLDWVYGYRGSDTKRNLWVLRSGELLYYVAAVAVIMDVHDDIQRHYTEHTEDIQCMALHPTRELVASGQRASRGRRTSAHVRVWHARTLNTLHVLGKKELGAGILAVAFSKRNNGEFLLAVDADKEHLLSVWTWDSEHILGKVATHQDHVWGAAFHPLDNNLIIIHGRGLLSLWSRRKDGIFTRSDLLDETSGRTVTTLEFTPSGDLITGDTEGVLTVWSVDANGDHYIKTEFQAHNGGVSALQLLSEGTVLSGGDKDRKIVAWDCDEEFEKVTETKLPDQAGGVRSVYPQRPGHNDGNIYVGTTRNMILEGSLQRRFNQIIFGHSKQLWGLSVNHVDGSLGTAGYDKHIVKWRENTLDWRIQAQSECVSVAMHPQGTRIAAGTIDGHLVVLNGHSGQHVTTVRVCGSPLSCLAYNPGGEILAVGSQNGSIYLYKSTKDGFVYTRMGKMSGAQPLSSIDWSTSGRFLQTVTSDYDIAYWSVGDLSKVKNSQDAKNESWASQTCPLGYMVHGIWSGFRDAPIQVTVDRSPRGDLLAAGDTDGYIRLYRYPVLSIHAGYHEYKVYTSYVSSVRFSHTDNYLYTIGGTDAALMRWRIT